MAEDLPYCFSPLDPKGSEKLKNFRPSNRQRISRLTEHEDLVCGVGVHLGGDEGQIH